ncbi:glycosyltransferase family 39 protein [bacterium]|nr:glycosyltransferase family 39 protein [bacterium]
MAKKAHRQADHPQALHPYFLPVLLLLAGWSVLLVWKTMSHFHWRWDQISLLFQWGRFGTLQGTTFFSQWITTGKHLIWLAIFCLAAYGLGNPLLKKLVHRPDSRLDAFLFSTALGFTLMALTFFFLGVLQLYYSWVAVVFLLGAAGWGAWIVWTHREQLRPGKGWLLGQSNWMDKFLLIAVFGFLLLVGMMVTVPEIFFDSLVYHLAVPDAWIKQQGIHVLSYNFFSNLPLMIEMLYTGALLVADERLCRMLHALLGLLGALAIFSIGRRFYGRRAGLWAAGLFLTVPVVVMNMQTCGVDAGAAFFAAMGFLALWAGLSDRHSNASPYLAGILVGMAVASKYNTVFMLGPAALFLLWQGFRRKIPVKTLLLLAIKIGLTAFCILMPWWLKNTVNTGNPVAPFMYKHIPTKHLHPEKMQQQMDGFKEYGKRNLLQYFRQPWDLTFYQPTSNSYVGVVFLFLLPGMILMLLFWRRGPPIQLVMLLTCLATAVLWSSQTQITRYYIPALPLLTILCAAVIKQWQTWNKLLGSIARLTTLGLVFWGLLCTAGIAIPSWDPVGAFLGLESRDTYLARRLMSSYHGMAKQVNQLPDPVKVLLVGETRTYYFSKPATAATVYDTNPWIDWIDRAENSRAVWERLRAQGYTHVFVHSQEAVRTRGYEKYHWNDAALQKLRELQTWYLKPIATDRQQWIFEIVDTPDLAQPVKTGRPLYTYDSEVTRVVGEHNSRVYFYLQQGKMVDARATWMRMIELTPDWLVPYTNLGWYYLQNNMPVEALQMYQKADRMGWLDPGSYNNLGVQYMSRGDHVNAEKRFRLALILKPDFEVAKKNLDAVLLKKHD